jgi:hypothetical protein
MKEVSLTFYHYEDYCNSAGHTGSFLPAVDFDGCTPFEMHAIVYAPFGPDSLISLQKLSEYEYAEIPLVHQMRYFGTEEPGQGNTTDERSRFIDNSSDPNIG